MLGVNSPQKVFPLVVSLTGFIINSFAETVGQTVGLLAVLTKISKIPTFAALCIPDLIVTKIKLEKHGNW